MGKEKYFSNQGEAHQFLEDLVKEIFRYEQTDVSEAMLPIFICFDFLLTEALAMINEAFQLSQQRLNPYSGIYTLVVKEYLESLRSALGTPIKEEEIQLPYFREDLAWRNRSISMLEEITCERPNVCG